MLGDILELKCEASGTPPPKISWSKSGTRLMTQQGTYEGPVVTFESVQKDNAGVYQCLADNKIGEPATAAVTISVICKY